MTPVNQRRTETWDDVHHRANGQRGKKEIRTMKDGWTVKTKDRSCLHNMSILLW